MKKNKTIEEVLDDFDKLAMEKGFSAEVGDQMTEYVVTTDDVRNFLKSLYENEQTT